MKQTILIITSGGLIQEICSNDINIQVVEVVYDKDEINDAEQTRISVINNSKCILHEWMVDECEKDFMETVINEMIMQKIAHDYLK